MSPLLIFMLLSRSLLSVRSIRESFCHLFFFVRGNGLRVLVYYMHYALRHKWTYQKKKIQVRKLHIVSIQITQYMYIYECILFHDRNAPNLI